MNQKNKKIRVAVLFGGRSCEHEVSIQSAKNIMLAMDRNRYEIYPVAINHDGQWFLMKDEDKILSILDTKPLNELGKKVFFNGVGHQLISLEDKDKDNTINHIKVDVVFPITHGPYGEDGTLQGVLKYCQVPFVGADVLGSAVGMDKEVMKNLLIQQGLPTARFITLYSYNYNDLWSFEKIQQKLGLPFFIKPANMGSSVGVHKIKSLEDYKIAIKDAFSYDVKLLAEEFIQGREIECAVLGNDEPKSSVVGEIIPQHEFYSYEAKYLDDNGALLKIPAQLSPKVEKQIQALSIEVFKTLNCFGLARVDFFVTKNDQIFINEINTLPGFTKISMYPKLWEASGISYSILIDRLINLAIERHQRIEAFQSVFNFQK